MRRYLYFFIIVAVIILIVLVFLFLRNRAATPEDQNQGIIPGGLPGVGTQSNQPSPQPGSAGGASGDGTAPSYVGQKFGIVAQNHVLAYHVDPQNNAFLVQPDGQIAKVSNGNSVILSSSVISGLISAVFSYDGNKILALFGDPAKPQASVFDVATRSWQPLSQTVISASWSPSNYQIAYLAPGNGVTVLTTLDLSNSKAKPVALLSLHAADLSLRWIGATQIVMSDKGSTLSNGSVWSFDIKGKTLQKLVGDMPGLDSIWSTAANMGLVFGTNANGYGGVLTIFDAAGNTLNNLSFLTLPEKCAFFAELKNAAPSQTAASSSKNVAPAQTIEKSLYCAIPRDGQKMGASRLPDDYQMRALFTEDSFYKVSLADGNTESVFADQAQALDAIDLKIFNQTLFFINRLDQKLYAISLK